MSAETQGLLRVPLLPDGAVGRPGVASPSPTASASARCWTATACAPAATTSPATTWWSWPPRSACSTSPPTRSSQQGPPAAGPACSCVDTAAEAGSSPTTSSRSASPAPQPYAEWLEEHHGPARRAARAGASVHRARPRDGAAAAGGLRLHLRGRAACSSTPWPPTAPSPSARWAPTRRWRSSRSSRSSLFDYFKQLFAQVTNPPVDAIREELIMAIETARRAGGQPARARAGVGAASWRCPSPVIRNEELEKIRALDGGPGSQGASGRSRCRSLFKAAGGRRRPAQGARGPALERSRSASPRATTSSSSPTAASTPMDAPIPALLAVSAVQHHLIREGTRTRCGLVLESGEPREVHHFALLIGYGASRHQPLPRLRDHRRPGASWG